MLKLTTLVISLCLMTWIGLVTPVSVAAAPPPTAGAEKCVECHENETNIWLNSPHALATENGELAATCEGCHGEYVEDHPDNGYMQLTVDSSTCRQCHASTFDQWETTTHAKSGVQCIGCHMSHSQTFRLSDEARCGSCHRERQQDFDLSAHGLAGTTCIDCHMTETPTPRNVTFISTRAQEASIPAPSHDFTAVPEVSCVACHTDNAHTGLMVDDQERANCARVVSSAASAPILADQLDTAQQINQALKFAAPVALGLGISLGAALGIGSFLIFCHYNQRRSDNASVER